VQRGKTTVRWHTIGAWRRYGGGVGQQIGVTKTLLCYWALQPIPPHYRCLHQDQAAAFLGRRLHVEGRLRARRKLVRRRGGRARPVE
jgi:hypothetical protein